MHARPFWAPLANTAYNYLGSVRGTNDIGRLLQMLPSPAVHAGLVLALALYGIGLWVVFKRTLPLFVVK